MSAITRTDLATSDSHAPELAAVETVRGFLQTLTFSFAGPAYILISLWTSKISLDQLGNPAMLAVVLYVVLAVLGFGFARLLGTSRQYGKAAVLSLASTNCANYGLPIVLFAFGEEGLVIGSVFMVAHVLIHLTLGLGIASWDTRKPVLSRLRVIVRFPYVYAIAAALLLRASSIEPPLVLSRLLEILGGIWIPLMLLLLGMELARMRLGKVWRSALMLSVMKLTLPPLLAWGLTNLLGIQGLAQAVLIIQSSMPTAVNGLLVARQCDTRPDLVASTLLLSTVGSILTLSVLLGILA